MFRWAIPLAVLAGTAIGYAIWKFAQIDQSKLAMEHEHRRVESRFSLNEAMKKDLPRAPKGMLLVTRFRDADGNWHVALGEELPESAQDSYSVGFLYASPSPPHVTEPVFYCRYAHSTALDSSPKCSGLGKPLPPQPAGYVSKLVRAGFYLLYRCNDPQGGMYPSLNPRCEDPKHFWEATLGSIRSAE